MNLNIPLSGMTNAGNRLGVSANNIANMNTPGYRARSVTAVEVEEGGVRTGEVRESPVPGSPDVLSLSGEAASNVDLATESVGNILFTAAYQANAAVLRAENSLLGTVIDLRR